MAIKMNQSLKQTQTLSMTPQLQQAIEMLTYTHLEMGQVIEKQLQENPLLEEAGIELTKDEIQNKDSSEIQAKEATSENFEAPELVEGGRDEFDWQKYMESQNAGPTAGGSASQFNGNDEQPNYENIVSRGDSLVEHLLWQLRMENYGEEDWQVFHNIVHNITDEGYLDATLEEIASSHDVSLEHVESLLKVVHGLDPIGCGARDLKECLLIQSDFLDQHVPIVEKMILHHLEDLQNKNYKKIAAALGTDYNSVVEAEHIILSFHPKPGRLVSPEEPEYVVPDVYVKLEGDEFRVWMNDEGVPTLRISKLYQSLMKSAGKGAPQDKTEAKEYVAEKLRSAMWLIKSIQNRKKTIMKVSEAIVRYQPEFFHKGTAYLKPMILKDIAQEIGMHESTVSRVTQHKYMHTPIGLFPFRHFFSSGVGGKNGGIEMASESLKLKIKKLIEQESLRRPLSDQKIADILKLEEIEIARRTVAKYRELMNILPSSKRKKIS